MGVTDGVTEIVGVRDRVDDCVMLRVAVSDRDDVTLGVTVLVRVADSESDAVSEMVGEAVRVVLMLGVRLAVAVAVEVIDFDTVMLDVTDEVPVRERLSDFDEVIEIVGVRDAEIEVLDVRLLEADMESDGVRVSERVGDAEAASAAPTSAQISTNAALLIATAKG